VGEGGWIVGLVDAVHEEHGRIVRFRALKHPVNGP
jgi:hypothetical protein